MRRAWPLFALVASCRIIGAGVPGGPDGGEADAGDDPGDAATDAPRAPGAGGRFDARADLGSLEVAEPPGVPAPPAIAGCADGTREGFGESAGWPDIAGCSGAWQVPGLLGALAREPQCGRRAGNDGAERGGAGCSVADLCAAGWHVCRDPGEVDRRSPTDCESASAPGTRRLFIVLSAATPQGLCLGDGSTSNDLHGCGTLGQPGGPGCQPLDRRMGFADCLATAGLWTCGEATDHLDEATRVTKSAPAGGGVLCCRDD